MDDQQDKIATEQVGSLNCVSCDKQLDVAHLPSFSTINCPECGAKQVIPAVFGSFILLGRLGAGGMGVIYHAQDRELGRHVALKVMKKELGENREVLAAFKREARAAASLNHRNVVQLYSFGQHEGQPYIVMELVDGGRLDDMIAEEGQLGELRALEVHVEVAEGLKAAGDVGLIHGDVKPANILFGTNGEAKVVDFGLASFIGQQHEQNGQIWGTPFYIAPEKARRQPVDFRSDIYSLGATLFHTLAGEPPFDGPTPQDVVLARLNQPAPDLMEVRDDLHPQTAAMVARMLEATPSMRYPSYVALLYDMREALAAVRNAESQGAKSKTSTSAIPLEGGGGRSKLAIAGIVLGALLLAGGGIAGHILYRDHKARLAAEAAEQARLQEAKTRGINAYTRAKALTAEISGTADKVAEPVEKINKIADGIKDAASLAEDAGERAESIQEIAGKAAEVLNRVSEIRYGLDMAADSGVALNTVEKLESLVGVLEEKARTAGESLATLEQAFGTAAAMHEKALRAAERERERKRKAEELAKQEEERKKAEEEARRRKLLEQEEAERKRAETIQRELDMIDEARGANASLIAERKFDKAGSEFAAVLPRLSMPESKAHHKNVLEAYEAMAGLKKFLIGNIEANPYPGGWVLGGTRRDIVGADAGEGLKIALGTAGATFIPWKQAGLQQLLRIAQYYLERGDLSTSEQADVVFSMALFCYETGEFRLAEQCAAIASRLNPRLETKVEQMMPGLLSPEDRK